jgi:DNA-binding response OmpR family regulator
MVKILLVEPDRPLAKTYASALQSAGHAPGVSGGAQAAILAADHIKPDLVILELQLVEHSGIEFLYEFRSYDDWQATPVIIHSHVPQNEFAGSLDVLKSQLGVSVYLYKPQTSLKDLILAVQDELAAVKA